MFLVILIKLHLNALIGRSAVSAGIYTEPLKSLPAIESIFNHCMNDLAR